MVLSDVVPPPEAPSFELDPEPHPAATTAVRASTANRRGADTRPI